jgi:hypothetical protein
MNVCAATISYHLLFRGSKLSALNTQLVGHLYCDLAKLFGQCHMAFIDS